jgi:2-C-methyl-D-erythritol 4-phosphate cytidylyltransferase
MLLLGAGRGARFGGDLPKAFVALAGRPILLRSAERLRELAGPDRAELIVMIGAEDRLRHLPPIQPALAALGAKIIEGGQTRQESMRRGLEAASSKCDLVLVHDAARPLFDIASARNCIRKAEEMGAALLATPVTDTIKRAGKDHMVAATVDRTDLWAAQTPQVIRRNLLSAALDHAQAHGLDATDDTGIVESMGGLVAIVPSTTSNLKITRPEDLDLATALLQRETNRD